MSTNAQVLVTGWNGFLGGYLCDAIVTNGGTLVRCGRVQESDVRCDLSETIPLLPDTIDNVIHAAGLAHKPSKESDRDSFQRGNVETTLNLLKALEQLEGDQINEDAATDPLNEYGISKLDAEQLVWNWTRERNIDCYIFRLPLIVGRSAPGNLQQLIRSIRAGRFVLPGGGNARKSMVLAQDVAQWAADTNGASGIFNLTDQIDPSYLELCNAITAHYSLRSIPKIPEILMNVAGKIGDIGSALTKRPLPYNSSIHQQLTKSLTFSSERAIKFGWRPNSVIENSKNWLE